MSKQLVKHNKSNRYLKCPYELLTHSPPSFHVVIDYTCLRWTFPIFLCVIWGSNQGPTHARRAFRHSAMAPDPLFFHFWICTWGVHSTSAISRTNYALDEWALVSQWRHGFSLGRSGAKWRGTLLYDLIFSLNTFWVCTSCAAPSACPSIVWFTIHRVPENSTHG